MTWQVYAFFVPLLFAIYQSFSKLLPKGISVFLINAYASLVGAAIMLGLHLLTRSDKSLRLAPKTWLLALGIGLLISLGNFCIIKAYSLGAPQSSFTPFVYILLIVYGIIFGFLFWREKLNLMQGLGILLAFAGVFLIFKFKK